MNPQHDTERALVIDRAPSSLLRQGSSAVVQPGRTPTWASALRALQRWPLIMVANAAITSSLRTGCAYKTNPAPPRAQTSAQLQPSGEVAAPLSAVRLEDDLTADALNLNVTRSPSPLRPRVYEFRSDTAFVQADFMALHQSHRQRLGNELVARDDIVLRPGAIQPLARTLSPQTRFIGVQAAYREVERSYWRALMAVQPSRANLSSLTPMPWAARRP